MIVSCDRQRVADIAANSGSCAMRASVWGKGRGWPEEGEDEEMHRDGECLAGVGLGGSMYQLSGSKRLGWRSSC